jgi:hypothetical protein
VQGVEARDALWHLQTKVLCSNVVLLDTRYHAVGVPPNTMAETTNEAVVQKKQPILAKKLVKRMMAIVG